MARKISHLEKEHRFQTTEEGHVCLIDYQQQQGIMAILHTRVPPAVEGRGIAAELTRYALETARRNGLKVKPVCSYTQVYFKRHPEYQDLLISI